MTLGVPDDYPYAASVIAHRRAATERVHTGRQRIAKRLTHLINDCVSVSGNERGHLAAQTVDELIAMVWADIDYAAWRIDRGEAEWPELVTNPPKPNLPPAPAPGPGGSDWGSEAMAASCKILTATGDVTTAQTALLAITNGATLGSIVLRRGGAGGTIIVNAMQVGAFQHVEIPEDGLVVPGGLHATLTTTNSIAFWLG